MKQNIIAVDFDGTLCENKWPEIGMPNEELIEYLKRRQTNGEKLILWTSRNEEQTKDAVEWCKKYGLIFDAVNDNLPEIVEAFGGNCRKIFANEYIDDRNRSINSCRERSSMERWAENEVAIACRREKPDRKDGEWDYGCACYESALKAFNSLCEDGHSGFSIGLTKAILNRLIDNKPLLPIEDTDDGWNKCNFERKDRLHCDDVQCRALRRRITMEHSKNYSKVKLWYSMKMWNETRVRNAVKMGWITKEEFAEITGKDYE